MFKVNENFAKLPGSYLFANIAKRVSAFQAEHPEKEIIRLGIGDVTQPIAPAIIEAMHKAVDEMGHAETFHGYAPEQGYDFLRTAATSLLTRSSYPTAQSVTAEISRNYSP